MGGNFNGPSAGPFITYVPRDLADARDRRPIETFDGQPAVVGIQVVDQDEQIARLRRFLSSRELLPDQQ